MSTSFAILFIIGKAAIWLLLPLGFGIWEWRRHRKMMARGETGEAGIPAWLRADGRQRVAYPKAPAPSPVTHAPVPSDPQETAAPETVVTETVATETVAPQMATPETATTGPAAPEVRKAA